MRDNGICGVFGTERKGKERKGKRGGILGWRDGLNN